MIRVSPNGHLHFALILALVLAGFAALAVPVTRSATQDPAAGFGLSPAGEKVAEALGLRSGPLTAAIASALVDDADAAYTETITPVLAANLVPGPLLKETAGLMGADSAELATLTGHYSTFSLHQNGLSGSYSSAAGTVGEALAELGVEIGPGDVVHPTPGTPLTPGLNVYVDPAATVRLIVAGEEETVHTQAETVAALLREQGIELEGKDRVVPGLPLRIRDDVTVRVTTLRQTTEYEETPIPFTTVYRHDASLPAGQQTVVQKGKSGALHRELLVTRRNGEEIASEVVSEKLTPAVEQIIAMGAYVPASEGLPFDVPGAEVVCARTLNVWATWYTAASSGGSGITRTGTGVYKGIIAVDPTVIPLGTRMYVPGYGFGLAADTGGGIKGNMIDLGYGPNDPKDWRTGPVEICILD